MSLEKNKKRIISRMISEILGIIYQEQYIYWGIVQSLNIDYERIKILHDIFVRIDILEEEQLQERIYRYGSLITEEDLLARQMFLCLHNIAKEKFVAEKKDITGER